MHKTWAMCSLLLSGTTVCIAAWFVFDENYSDFMVSIWLSISGPSKRERLEKPSLRIREKVSGPLHTM